MNIVFEEYTNKKRLSDFIYGLLMQRVTTLFVQKLNASNKNFAMTPAFRSSSSKNRQGFRPSTETMIHEMMFVCFSIQTLSRRVMKKSSFHRERRCLVSGWIFNSFLLIFYLKVIRHVQMFYTVTARRIRSLTESKQASTG